MPLSPTTSLELNMKITVLCHRSLHFARYAVSVVLAVCVLTAASPAAAATPEADAGAQDGGVFSDISFGLKSTLAFSQHSGIEERDAEYDVGSLWRTGFGASAFVYIPITPRFGIQQEISYVQKGSRQDIGVEILDVPTVLSVTYDMDYIEIPVLLRFAWHESRSWTLYSLAGTALSLKVHDRYVLEGELDDGDQVGPLRADSDMSEVDLFDYSFVYGLGLETPALGHSILLEYRFTIGWNTLHMPTYAYVPFEDDEILIENEPVPLKNQSHALMLGIAF